MKAFRAKKARPKKLTQVKKSRSWLRYRFFINFNLVVSSSGHMVLEDCSMDTDGLQRISRSYKSGKRQQVQPIKTTNDEIAA